MPGGGVALAATADVNRVEAPVTWKAYLMCAFASFGGIFFGYDSGYINGVLGTNYFIHSIHPGIPIVAADGTEASDIGLSSSNKSLIVSILSCGTFFGALIAGDLADIIGRKWTIIMGCVIYIVGKFTTCPVPDSDVATKLAKSDNMRNPNCLLTSSQESSSRWRKLPVSASSLPVD